MMKQLEIIDLFAGIGGFSYAFDQVFHDFKRKHIFVENDPFCTAVLKKHWPEAEYHGDIRTFTNTESGRKWASQQERSRARESKEAARDINRVFILTGGFPCQPFSQAGVRKGTSDDRFLWPEMFRVISEFRPQWFICENVSGLLSIENGMVFEQVCSDLEREGYEVWPFVIPACSVGAPHRRDRVWIVGYTKCDGERRERRIQGRGKTESQSEQASATHGTKDTTTWSQDWREVAFATCNDGIHDEFSTWLDSLGLDVYDTMMGYGTESYKRRTEELSNLQKAIQSEEIQRKIGGLLTLEETPVLLEVLRQYICRVQASQQLPEKMVGNGHQQRSLQSVWLEEIRRASDRYPSYRWGHHEQLVRELRDTLPFLSYETSHAIAEEGYRLWLLYKTLQPSETPVRMDGTTISAARHRKDRLKACGNAIVPQVAMKIMEGIRRVTH